MRLVADANVLLSALIGGRAKQVLQHPSVEQVLTVAPVLEEVAEYLPILGRQRGLDEQTLLMDLASLPVRVVDEDEYKNQLAMAQRRIGGRDPDDVSLVALALATHLPVWTNDNDFEGIGVEWYTTAELLKRLGHPGRG